MCNISSSGTHVSLQKSLKTTGKYIRILSENGIHTVHDLLFYFPRTYEDRRNLKTLQEVGENENDIHVVQGKIIKKTITTTPKGKKLIHFVFQDTKGHTGIINILHRQYLFKTIRLHVQYFIIGKVQIQHGTCIFWHPEIIKAKTGDKHNVSNIDTGRIYPIYPELQGIKSQRFAKKIFTLLQNKQHHCFVDHIPKIIKKQYQLIDKKDMVSQLHFPCTMEMLKKAKYRFFFEKLLILQIHSLLVKKSYQTSISYKKSIDRNIVKKFLKLLPFTLTYAQKKAIKECIEDIHSGTSMMRLLQGDVGSGKTIVAIVVSYYVITHLKQQVAFLVPLGVLAHQHFKNIAKLFLPLGISLQILVGSQNNNIKQKIKIGLAGGSIDCIIGTHALIQENVSFKNLGLVIIDEQHKFGVKQRSFLKQQGSPHILQMTATPIPRSLALAFFGEFSLSIIDEMPSGRKKIITKIINEKEFLKLKPRILSKIQKGQKVFIVTPLIEESQYLDDIKSATQVYQEISNLYREVNIGLIHGNMGHQEKENVMKKFQMGDISFLVATTVIEVGIDIPEASIIIIMNAERFGLSQLHQLRGRVGRSDIQSYCFLYTEKKYGDAYHRLRHLENTHNGFQLAEIDMKMRGSGELMGTKQSGSMDIPISLLSDTNFIQKTRDAAQYIVHKHTNIATQYIQSEQSLHLI